MGTLRLDILSASTLEAVDGSSDPYCTVILNHQKVFKSKAEKKTLDPVFNETCLIPIQSRSRAKLSLEIRDKNTFSSDIVLGSLINIDLKRLVLNQPYSKEYRLQNARSGKIKLRMTFFEEDVSDLRSPLPTSTSKKGLRSLSTSLRKSVNMSDAALDAVPLSAASSIRDDHHRSVSSMAGAQSILESDFGSEDDLAGTTKFSQLLMATSRVYWRG